MPLDLEEQEQLANLKAFWVNYGRWLALGILIALIGYSGYRFYQKYQDNISLDAAKVYEELMVASSKTDFPSVVKKAEEIQSKYAGTTYAAMAGLVTANLAYSINDMEKAKSQLQWVEEKSNSKSLQTVARLRLATLLMDQKDESSLQKADELLKKSVASGFESLQLERQGDVRLLQNKPDEAKKLYLQAWEFIDNQKAKQSGVKELDPMAKEFEKRNPGEGQRLLKIKIDSLGGF